jgi:hypothetical protein
LTYDSTKENPVPLVRRIISKRVFVDVSQKESSECEIADVSPNHKLSQRDSLLVHMLEQNAQNRSRNREDVYEDNRFQSVVLGQ